MADYSSVGAFNTGNAASLSGDMITKIREAEEKAVLDPIDERLGDWEIESEKVTEIKAKVSELLDALKPFDLYSGTNNAFEQVTANTSGTSAVFDAADVGSLKEGTYQVDVTHLAQKDVFQSIEIDATDIDSDTPAVLPAGKLSIQVGANSVQEIDADGLTYAELAEQISLLDGVTGSLEQTSDTKYRLVIKSTNTGLENTLKFNGDTSQTLGLTTDGTDALLADGTDATEAADTSTQDALNLVASVDGVTYNVSSNSIQVDGNLKITATQSGKTTLSIQKDDSYILPAAQEIVTKYNEVTALITEELYNADTSVEDLSSLRTLQDGLKNIFYQDYGSNDENPVNIGFEFDQYGGLSLNTETFGKALTDNFDNVKEFFLGKAEDKGFGTTFKEYIDDLNSYNGLFSVYEDSMTARKNALDEDRKDTVTKLDTKYATMAAQFTSYATIIAQMESSFSGLKMMIEQSTSSS